MTQPTSDPNGAPTPTTPPAGDPAPTTPPSGVSDPAGGTPPPAGDGAKTFTQADLDRIIADRLKSEQAKFQTQLEEIKATAGKSDLEAAQIKLQATEGKLTEVTKAAAQRIAKTEAKVAALSAGAKSDRVAAVIAQADLTDAVSEDGDVDEGKVAAAIGKVLETFPEWKAATVPGSSGGELNPATQTGKSYTRAQIKAMSVEDYQAQEKDILDAMANGRITG